MSVISTDDLVKDYFEAKKRFHAASEALQNRAVEESGFKVGDIIQTVPGAHGRKDFTSRLIVRIVGKIAGSEDNTRLGVKAWTRKRTGKGGWHGTPNEHWDLQSKPMYKGDSFYEVIGHEEVAEDVPQT
jgi:hypothetical protein